MNLEQNARNVKLLTLRQQFKINEMYAWFLRAIAGAATLSAQPTPLKAVVIPHFQAESRLWIHSDPKQVATRFRKREAHVYVSSMERKPSGADFVGLGTSVFG